MKIFLFLIPVIIITAILSSCDKDTPIADYDVTITVLEPATAVAINSGDTLHLEIDFEGTRAINNMEITVKNITTGDTIAYYPIVTNDTYYPFHEHIVPIVAVESDCMVIASAWDFDLTQKISKEVIFPIHP